MNDKYLVKIEAGPYEQVYKVDQMEIEGLTALKELINDVFLEKVASIFRTMHAENPWK